MLSSTVLQVCTEAGRRRHDYDCACRQWRQFSCVTHLQCRAWNTGDRCCKGGKCCYNDDERGEEEEGTDDEEGEGGIHIADEGYDFGMYFDRGDN